MTDEDVVRRFAEVVGFGKVTMPTKREGRKQQWQWRGFGAAAMAQLDVSVGPWLGTRRRARLDEMLTFEPRRDGAHGRWIGDRWFADPARMRVSTVLLAEEERVRRVATADEARELIETWTSRRDGTEYLLALGREERRSLGFKANSAQLAAAARIAGTFLDRLEARAAELDQDGSGLDS